MKLEIIAINCDWVPYMHMFWVLVEIVLLNTYKICVVFNVLLTATVIWSREPQLKVSSARLDIR